MKVCAAPDGPEMDQREQVNIHWPNYRVNLEHIYSFISSYISLYFYCFLMCILKKSKFILSGNKRTQKYISLINSICNYEIIILTKVDVQLKKCISSILFH